MVKQTLISFKCDSVALARFDELCKNLGCKRNRLLNFLVYYANKNFDCYPFYAEAHILSDVSGSLISSSDI